LVVWSVALSSACGIGIMGIMGMAGIPPPGPG
jgi:hypothetical protein